MKTVFEVLMFKRMISPVVLQFLFWAAIGGCLYGTYVLFKLGNGVWPVPLIFGPFVIRVMFEKLILDFRVYDRLHDIHAELKEARKEEI